jgi:hypothetical protein
MAMPTYAKASRGSVGGGKIGTTGDAIYLKISQTDHDFQVPYIETTGDGDSTPQYESSGIIYGRLSVSGWFLSGQTAGIASGSFASGTSLAWIQTWSTNRTITGTLLVGRSRATWVPKGRGDFLAIALNGVFVGTLTEA